MKFLRSPFVIGAIVFMIFLPLFWGKFFRRIPEPPPVIGQVPHFVLTDQNGNPFSDENMRGNVYIVDFIFTTCPSVCPLMTSAMKKLEARYHEMGNPNFKLLSITVDPENDSHQVLKQYGEKFQADFSRWTFLTGAEKDIRRLIEKGFMQHVGEKMEVGGSLYDIAHSKKFAIVDQSLGIRGFYSFEGEGVDEIFHRSIHVFLGTKSR